MREVFPGNDGKVRKVALSYKNFRVCSGQRLYGGGSDTVIIRSVQRLALLVPVDNGWKSYYSNPGPPGVLVSIHFNLLQSTRGSIGIATNCNFQD